jgi:glutathione S-transferase
MKLYNLAAGMNPRRVRIFLAEKQIDIETVDIDMQKNENRTDEFLAMNPMGTLPVLELDDGSYLSESMAICRYFEALHPEPALMGRTPLETARVEMWNRRMELEILVNTGQYFRHSHPFWVGRVDQIPAHAEQCRERLLQRMQWLDTELSGREFIATDHYTVADITAQCAFIVAKACKLRIGEDTPNLLRWFEAVTARPTSRA